MLAFGISMPSTDVTWSNPCQLKRMTLMYHVKCTKQIPLEISPNASVIGLQHLSQYRILQTFSLLYLIRIY